MKIHRVTFTGADDTVEVAALQDFAEEFGFVEFGILFSNKRQGNEPRYPTHGWLNGLLNNARHLRLAAHACGSFCKSLVTGDNDGERWFDEWAGVFDRVQLNGAWSMFEAEDLAAVAAINQGLEFIVQCSGSAVVDVAIEAQRRTADWEGPSAITALYDASGGRGITTASWPEPPARLRLGYAGGIGPDNIDDVLDQLARIDGPPTWIDMESRVRSFDGAQFDLSLCRKVARAVARRRWP